MMQSMSLFAAHRRVRYRFAALVAAGWMSLSPLAPAQEVHLVALEGAVGPASADFVIRALEDAADAEVDLVVLRIDTPGGLDLAMRDIIQAMLASPVPIAGWVAPNGARAASAGTYILYASHIAAMATATNVGSSTPVSLGGGGTPTLPDPSDADAESDAAGGPSAGSAMERKVINDAVAYIESLADLRGRNREWARRTVVEAANLPAAEALSQNVIDLIADDLDSLLRQVDGRQLTFNGQTVVLEVTDARVTAVEPDWRHEFLALITNPNVAYILLMIGIYGLVLEFYNPGLGLPGITGVICLLLAAFALQMLPINYAALALLAVGVVLMIVEALSPSFGVFGFGGIAAFVLGSVMLMDSDLAAYRISLPIIGAVAVASAGVFLYVIGAAVQARRRQVTTGVETLIGTQAVALEDFQHDGRVRVHGEIWNAHSDFPVRREELVLITAVEGLTLSVKPAPQEE